ncbi:hypothetical protein TanjilG_18075 [Lupinus angustifolius]|uniref:Uncharacterized protein n=1 Tax=Lupinus angustifolius TaxID=3871 RepID=A0A1J7GVU5_LUPAN|nr:hypothetical protein TanjilG_18075 [Lupinus angustifolius]
MSNPQNIPTEPAKSTNQTEPHHSIHVGFQPLEIEGNPYPSMQSIPSNPNVSRPCSYLISTAIANSTNNGPTYHNTMQFIPSNPDLARGDYHPFSTTTHSSINTGPQTNSSNSTPGLNSIINLEDKVALNGSGIDRSLDPVSNMDDSQLGLIQKGPELFQDG